jgi:hypothetical protein
MSNLSDLLLREVVDANYQTKGATLTFAEVDNNFILLASFIRDNVTAANPGGIEPYVGSEEYSNGNFVTFNSNLWQYIYPTPSTGNAPSTESVFWALRSAGVLSHAQNTDTHTVKNRFGIGDATSTSHKEIFARNGSAVGQEPRIRYNKDTGVWEVSNNGTDFNPFLSTGYVNTGINVGGEIDLNFAGMPERIFQTAAPIATDIGIDISNFANATKGTWIFTIANLAIIHFPSDVLMSDARTNGIKQWTPFDNGLYKAEFTKHGANWLVDINGPYI